MAPEQSCRNKKCSMLKPFARNEGVCACNLCIITHRNISGELRYLKQFKLHLILTLYYFENDHKRKQVHIQHTCTSVFLTQACGCAGVTPTHIQKTPLFVTVYTLLHWMHLVPMLYHDSHKIRVHLVGLQFTSFLKRLTQRNYLIENN